METDAKYLLIGTFALIALLGVLGFIVWLARVEITRETSYYYVDFAESVAGLNVGGDVRYRGIKVGTVTEMDIHPEDPRLARVTVEVSGTELREGDTATLVMQGITGVLFVNIEGAEPGSPPLEAEDERYPVVPTKPSAISAIFEGTPDLMTQAAVILDSLSQVMSEENRERINDILRNTQTMTEGLIARQETFRRILDSFDRSAGQLETAVISLRETMNRADTLMSDEVPGLIEEYRQTGASLRGFVEEAEAVLAENREPLHRFATEGLDELSLLTAQARRLLARLDRLTARLDNEGVGLLLPARPTELEVER